MPEALVKITADQATLSEFLANIGVIENILSQNGRPLTIQVLSADYEAQRQAARRPRIDMRTIDEVRAKIGASNTR